MERRRSHATCRRSARVTTSTDDCALVACVGSGSRRRPVPAPPYRCGRAGAALPQESRVSVRSYLTSMSDRPVFDTFAFDCPDPRALAGFYVELLGYSVSPESEDDWVTITGPGSTMTFQLAPDHVPSTWPMNDVPEQAHIDFLVTDIAAAHERVISLGGRAVDPVDAPKPSPSQGFRVYTDPPATASACAGPRRRLGDRSPVDGKDEAPGHCCSWSHRTFRGVLTPCLQIPQMGPQPGRLSTKWHPVRRSQALPHPPTAVLLWGTCATATRQGVSRTRPPRGRGNPVAPRRGAS